MNIHWSAYLAIGIAVTVVSALREGLQLFIAVGIIFIAVGIIKWLMRNSKKDDAHFEKLIRDRKIKETGNYTKCPYCLAWNYPYSRSCHYCSMNLRRRVESGKVAGRALEKSPINQWPTNAFSR